MPSGSGAHRSDRTRLSPVRAPAPIRNGAPLGPIPSGVRGREPGLVGPDLRDSTKSIGPSVRNAILTLEGRRGVRRVTLLPSLHHPVSGTLSDLMGSSYFDSKSRLTRC